MSFRPAPLKSVSLAACLTVAVALGGMLVFISSAAAQKPATPKPAEKNATGTALGDSVRDFARKQIGKQMGNGDADALATAALKSAGAKTSDDFKSLAQGDYVWGTEIKDYSAAVPGDIMQFRDVKFITKQGAQGAAVTVAHHTAIIESNLGGGKFEVLHQNMHFVGTEEKARKTVQKTPLDLNFKTGGTIWVYHPVKNDAAEEKK